MSAYFKKFDDGTSVSVRIDTRNEGETQGSVTLYINPLDASEREITNFQQLSPEMKEAWQSALKAMQSTTNTRASSSGIPTGMPNDYPTSITYRVDNLQDVATRADSAIKALGLQAVDVKGQMIRAMQTNIGNILRRSGLLPEEQRALLQAVGEDVGKVAAR